MGTHRSDRRPARDGGLGAAGGRGPRRHFGAGGRAVVDLGADEDASGARPRGRRPHHRRRVAAGPAGPRREGRDRRAPDAPGRHRPGLRGRLRLGPPRLQRHRHGPRPSPCSRTDGSWPPATTDSGNGFVARLHEPGRHARPDLRRGTASSVQPSTSRLPAATARSPYSPTAASWRSAPCPGHRRPIELRTSPPCGSRPPARSTPTYAGGFGWSRISFPGPASRSRSGAASPSRRTGRSSSPAAPSPFTAELRGRAPAEPPGDLRLLVRAGAQRHRHRPRATADISAPRSRSSPTGRSSSPAPARSAA